MKTSCIIPVGPTAQHCEHLIDAVQSVDPDHTEVIVVAAESVQFHQNIKAVKNLPGVRLIISDSLYMSDRFNLGVAAASHDWCHILCADDTLEPIVYLDMLTFLGSDAIKVDVLFGQVLEYNESRNLSHVWPWSHTANTIKLYEANCVCIGSLFRQKVWWEIRGWRNVPFTDWDFWKRAYSGGFDFQFFGERVFYNHRVWQGNTGDGQ